MSSSSSASWGARAAASSTSSAATRAWSALRSFVRARCFARASRGLNALIAAAPPARPEAETFEDRSAAAAGAAARHTTYQSRDACYFLLELVQGGELFSRLTTFPDGDFPAEETRFYSAATLLAMEYVHSQNMVYRDLKPENILIDTAGYVRVVDFGFAKRLAGEQPTFTIVGTPEYLSPECALGQGYRMDVDLWAFGVLVFEMLKGNGPFCPADPDDTMAIFKLISDCRIEFSRKEVSAFGVPATSLCKELLNRSRKKRLGNLKGGVKNIKDHAYFAGVDFHAILNRRIAAPWNPEVSDPFDTSCFDEYDEAMDIPTFAGDQHAFTEFSDGTIDDSHLVHNVQQQLLPTVH